MLAKTHKKHLFLFLFYFSASAHLQRNSKQMLKEAFISH